MGEQLSLRTSSGLSGLVLAAVLATVAAEAALGQDPDGERGDPRADLPVEITADQIVYDRRRQVYVAEGRVVVTQGARRIDADWIVFNRRTRRGIAAGRVRAVDGDDVLEARFIEFDDGAQQGLVLVGRLDLGEEDFRVAAGELVKTADDHYEGADVSMTTCRCPDDDDRLPWVINADEADVTLGGYAMVSNATVDVLGIPTLWLPWAAFPVKTERATGFLPPELRLGGGNGFEFTLPFFWAARDEVNVTLTPRYMTTRGFKPELLLETVYGRKSSSELFVSYLRDQDPDQVRAFFPDTSSPGDFVLRKKNQYDPDRWGVGFDNDVHAPLGWRLRSDIQLMSDNEYVRDFDEFRDHRRVRFVESTAFGFRHFGTDGSLAAVASVVHRDDRQNPNRVDRDDYLLHRAPSAELAWLPTRLEELLGVDLGIGADYTRFYAWKRADSVLDLSATSGGIVGDDRFLDIGIASLPDAFSDLAQRQKLGVDDGVFQEGEPLNDAGHRVVLHPQLGHSFRLFDLLDLRPEVGWHQTLYSTRAQDFEERGLLTGRVQLQTRLLGRFDAPGLPPLTHLLEPRVGWAYLWKARQSDNPLFVPATRVPQARLRQLSLDNRVLDDADRIDPANVLAVGLGNRFYAGSGEARRLWGELELSAAYDFRGAGAFGLAIAEGRLLPGSWLSSRFNFAWDLEQTRVDQGLFELSFPLEGVVGLRRSSRLRLGYRYRRAVGRFFESFESIEGVDEVGGTFRRFQAEFDRISQLSAGTRLRLSEQWAVDYELAYSLHRSTVLTNRGALEYTSKCRCWAIQLMVEDDRTRGLRYGANFTFLGFGMDRDEPFRAGGLFGTGMF